MDSENYNQLNTLNEETELTNRSSNCLLESDTVDDLSFNLNLNDPNPLKKEVIFDRVQSNFSSESDDIKINENQNIENLPKKVINWKDEIYRGNFMPAFCLLNLNKLSVNEIIDDNTENRLLHMSLSFSFTNVTRGLIEIFKSELNIKNRFGHTPFHILCNKEQTDIFLFSYMIKNEDLLFDERDRNGVTPLFFTINSNHNLDFLILMYKGANIYNIDNMGNSAMYFIITSDNKFSLNFCLRHFPKLSINARYYANNACLSEVLISCKGRKITKHLLKYHHHTLDLESIIGSQKSKDKFNFHNNFNYDLFNTLYYYKTKNYIGFINKLLSKDSLNNYSFKTHNVKFLIFDLIIPNMNEKIKYLLISGICFLYLFIFSQKIKILRFDSFYDKNEGLNFKNIIYLFHQMISFITLFLTLCYFYYNRIPKLKTCFNNEVQLSLNVENNPYYSDDEINNEITSNEYESNRNNNIRNKKNFKEPYYKFDNSQHNSDNILNILYQSVERNPLDMVFEEELCEICLIKKDKSTNHCYICNRCVKEHYFHSKFFNFCFHRKNIFYYILFFYSLMAIHLSYIYLIYNEIDMNHKNEEGINESESLYDSSYLTTNIVTFLLNIDFKGSLLLSYSFIMAILFFQQWSIMLLCYGYRVTYYNMFRMHKKCVGKLEQRKGKICNIPIVNTVSICDFIINLFK